jgi:PPOX class probable F420-dependent enzyme
MALTIPVHAKERLATAENIWLATVRQDATPHLVPIWFVWVQDRAYVCTAGSSVKVRNIKQNPHVTLSLEDASSPLVIEGDAGILDEFPASVVEAFIKKYDWDIRGSSTYQTLVEISPRRMRL